MPIRPQIDWDAIDEALTGGEPVSGEGLLIAAVVLALGFLVAMLIGRWRRRRLRNLDDQTGQFLGLGTRFAQVVVMALSVGWALTSLGANIGWLTIVLLVSGVVVVLAARPVLEGMGASAALVTRPAFSIGDEIQVDDVIGEVTEITNRSTVIRLRDGRRVHIPNVEMLSKTVTVYTVDQSRRSAVEVTVGFETDIEHAENVLRRELDGLDEIDRVGSVRAQELTQGVQLSVRFWHPSSIEEGNDAIDAAVRTIVATLTDEGIRFAPAPELAIVPDPNRGTAGDGTPAGGDGS
jgi:small-conductance mechanosensitive channel